jgi:Transcriptional regulators
LKKQKLKETAYNYIRDAIFSFEFKPGQAIVEQDLSEKLGISRTPLREALKQLELEGLVHQVPSYGTFVANITIQDVEELCQLRQLLETTALKTAIIEATDAELNAFEKKLCGLDDSKINESSGKEAYYGSDRDLHSLIMRYSQNSRMIAIHNNIEMQLERLRRISSMTPMRLATSKQEHLAIIHAMQNRDFSNALLMLTLHLNNVRESTLSICKNLNFYI